MGKKADKFYLDAEGVEAKHAHAKAVALLFRFVNGHEIIVNPSTFSSEMVLCGSLHGFAQKIGDGYAGAKDVDEAIESAETIIENLTEGNWIDRAEGVGVRTSLLAEALCRCKSDKYPDVEAAAKAVKEWDKDKRKQVLDSEKGVPALIKAYLEIQAERALARAEAAAKKAADAGDDEALNAL